MFLCTVVVLYTVCTLLLHVAGSINVKSKYDVEFFCSGIKMKKTKNKNGPVFNLFLLLLFHKAYQSLELFFVFVLFCFFAH